TVHPLRPKCPPIRIRRSAADAGESGSGVEPRVVTTRASEHAPVRYVQETEYGISALGLDAKSPRAPDPVHRASRAPVGFNRDDRGVGGIRRDDGALREEDAIRQIRRQR